MADTFFCPECQARLRRSATLRTGALVQCPKCQLQFRIPDEEDVPPEVGYSEEPIPRRYEEPDYPHDNNPDDRPASTATRRAEDPPRPRPEFDRYDRRSRDEEDEDYPPSAREHDDDHPGERDDRPLSGDYQANLSEWFSYAREHYTLVMGPAVGFLVLIFVIYMAGSMFVGIGVMMVAFALFTPGGGMGAPPSPNDFLIIQITSQFLSAVLQVLLYGPLLAGMTNVALAQLKGRRWSFLNFFGGFRRYGAVMTLALFNFLFQVPWICVTQYFQMEPALGNPVELLIPYALGLATLAVYGLLWVRLFFFALPLVLDRGYGPIEAIKGSWILSRGHYGGLLGIAIVCLLINAGGAMLCGIGLLFTLPFTSLVFAAGYLLANGTDRPMSLDRDYDEDYGPRYVRNED